MKKIFKYIPLLAAGFLLMGCQDNDEADFANKAFINATSMRTETIIKGEAGIVNKTLNVATPRPAESDIKVTARVDKSLVDTYNKAYYADAQLLPDSCYEVAEANMLINAGSVKSSDASFNFMKLSSLERSLIYVLPVTVDTRDIELLSSAKNYYFVFKAGALINVVADIQDNYLEIYPWKTQDRISGMTQIGSLDISARVRTAHLYRDGYRGCFLDAYRRCRYSGQPDTDCNKQRQLYPQEPAAHTGCMVACGHDVQHADPRNDCVHQRTRNG